MTIIKAWESDLSNPKEFLPTGPPTFTSSPKLLHFTLFSSTVLADLPDSERLDSWCEQMAGGAGAGRGPASSAPIRSHPHPSEQEKGPKVSYGGTKAPARCPSGSADTCPARAPYGAYPLQQGL